MPQDAKAKLPDIRKSALFEAPIANVWQAVATSEGIAAWYMPNDFQPVVGHKFHLQTPFGPVPCELLELDAPRCLSFAWGDSWRVSIELREVDSKTELTLVHSGWGAPDEIIPEVQETNAVIHDRMNNGWEPIINESLRELVER
jgi:uncharacterized protein YndB with AHSA1/START domain